MANIPAKQLFRYGTYSDLVASLSEREIGICSTDGLVYYRTPDPVGGENLVPIGIHYFDGTGIEIDSDRRINLTERTTLHPVQGDVIQGALQIFKGIDTTDLVVKVGNSDGIGALAPIPASGSKGKVLGVVGEHGEIGWMVADVSVDSPVDEVFTESSTYDETKLGYYATTSGYSQSALYDTFVFEADKDGTFFPKTFPNDYFSVVIFTDSSQTSGTRYRKLAGGEDTLPTENSPASFVRGNYIAITTSTGHDFSVVFNDYKTERVFEDDIIFSQGQIDQIVALQKNKVVCKFINGSGDGHSTQRFEVYVPAKIGYVKYQFVHSVSVEKNSDCWRIQSAVAVDDDFAYRFDLTKNGEWECAIRLVGRDDFSGGIIHGNEVLVDASFWADGEKLNLQTLTSTPFVCSKFRIATSSHLYDNADGTTNFADHGCEHIFSKDGCEIIQSIKFIVASDIMTAYLAMGLPSADITDHYIVDSDINGGVAAPASQKIITSDLQKFLVYGDSSGVAFTMELLKNYPFLQNPYRGLLVHSSYNKTYFVIRYNDSYNAAVNDLWLTRHRVNFEVGK